MNIVGNILFCICIYACVCIIGMYVYNAVYVWLYGRCLVLLY